MIFGWQIQLFYWKHLGAHYDAHIFSFISLMSTCSVDTGKKLREQRIFDQSFDDYWVIVVNMHECGCFYHRRVSREGDWGICPSSFTKKFFNLLGFLRKNPENPPLKFFHTTNLKIPPLEKFLATHCFITIGVIKASCITRLTICLAFQRTVLYFNKLSNLFILKCPLFLKINLDKMDLSPEPNKQRWRKKNLSSRGHFGRKICNPLFFQKISSHESIFYVFNER